MSVSTVALSCALLAIQPNVLWAQDVVSDGRTNTTITVNGAITDVHTTTVGNGSGYNSLSRLNVSAGRTVNMHVPNGATRTINIVRGEATTIAGQLRSMQNGVVGGGLVVANPQGIVVTGTGEVVAGSFTATTPTAEFLTDFFGPDGTPDAAKSAALLDGTVPQANVDVSILGTVRAGSARLQAGQDVIITGVVEADDRAAAIANVANLGSLNVRAGRDVLVNGTLRASKADGTGARAGGDIEVSAGRDVTGAGLMSVAAMSGDASAGSLVVRADRNAHFTGIVTADGYGGGDGGAIDIEAGEALSFSPFYSAKRGVDETGSAGSIRFASRIMRIDMDLSLEGADITLEATEQFELASGTTINTQNNGLSAPYLDGPSGDIIIRAPSIVLEQDAVLDAGEGTYGPPSYNFYSGGTVLLEALANDVLTALQADATAQIDLGLGVEITGGDVTIRAVATSVADDRAITDLLSLTPDQNNGFTSAGLAVGHIIDETVQPDGGVEPGVSVSANARVTSAARRIRADSGDVTIEALATTTVDLNPTANEGTIIALKTETDARVDILQSYGNGATRGQEIWADTTNITARSTENQNISIKDKANGLASLVVSDRDASAIVAFGQSSTDRLPQIDNLNALAETVRDINLEIIPEGPSFAAVSAIISRQDATTVVAGNNGSSGILTNVMARDRTIRDRMYAQAATSGTSQQTGAGYLQDVADLFLQSMNPQNGDSLSQDELIAAAAPIALANAALSGVVSSSKHQTLASTASVTVDGEQIGATLDLAPYSIMSSDRELHVTAETIIDAVNVQALAETDGTGSAGIVLGHAHVNRDVTTRAVIENMNITTGNEGAVTVSARTVLPDAATPGSIAASAANPNPNIAGSITIVRLDTNTEAVIGANANIHGEEDYSSYGNGGFGPWFPEAGVFPNLPLEDQITELVAVGDTSEALDDYLGSLLPASDAEAIAEMVRAKLGEGPIPSGTDGWNPVVDPLDEFAAPLIDGADITVTAETSGALGVSAGQDAGAIGSVGMALTSLRSTVDTRAAIDRLSTVEETLTSAYPGIGTNVLTITARDGTDLSVTSVAGATAASGGPAGALVGVSSSGTTQAVIDASRRVDALQTDITALANGSVTLDAGTAGGAGVGAGVAYLDGTRSILSGVGDLTVSDSEPDAFGGFMSLGTLSIRAEDARDLTLSADAGAGGGLRESLTRLGDIALAAEPTKVADLLAQLGDITGSWSEASTALADRADFISLTELPDATTDLNAGLAAAAAVRNDTLTVAAGLSHKGRVETEATDILSTVTSVATLNAGSAAVAQGEDVAGMLAGAVAIDLGTRTVRAILQDVGVSSFDAMNIVALVDDRTLIDAAAGGGVVPAQSKDLAGSVAVDMASVTTQTLVRRSAIWTSAPLVDIRAEARGLTRLGAGAATGAQPGEGMAVALDLSTRAVTASTDAVGNTARGTWLRQALAYDTEYSLQALDEGSVIARAIAADEGGQELGGSVAVLAGTRDTTVAMSADVVATAVTLRASSGTTRSASAGGEATGQTQRGAGQAIAVVYDRGLTAVSTGAGTLIDTSGALTLEALRQGSISADALSVVDIGGAGLASGNGAVALTMAGGTARVATDGVITAQGLIVNATRAEDMNATASGELDSGHLIGLGLSVAAMISHGDADVTLGGQITTGSQGLTAEAALDQLGTAYATGGVAVDHGIGGGANLAGGVMLGQATMSLGFGAQIDTGQATARFTSVDRSSFQAETDRGPAGSERNLGLSVAGFGGDRAALTTVPFASVSGGIVQFESLSQATYSALAEGDPALRVTLAGLGPAYIPSNLEIVGALAVTRSRAVTDFDRAQITQANVIRAYADAQIEGTATAVAQADAQVKTKDVTFTTVNGIDIRSSARSAAVIGAKGGVSLAELGGANDQASAADMIAEILRYASAARDVDIATRDIPNLPDISVALTGAAVEAKSDVQLTDSFIRSFNLLDILAEAETDLDLGRTADDLAVSVAASSTHSNVGVSGGDLDGYTGDIQAISREVQKVDAKGSARPEVPGAAVALSLRRASAIVDLAQSQSNGEGGYLDSDFNSLTVRAAIERDISLTAAAQPDLRAALAGAVALGYGEGTTQVTIGRVLNSVGDAEVRAETRNLLTAEAFAWAREDRGATEQADATPLTRAVADTGLFIADEMPVNRDGLDLDALVGAAGNLDATLSAGALGVAGMVLVDDTDVVIAPSAAVYATNATLTVQAENRMDNLRLRSGALTDGPATTGTIQTSVAAALNLGAFDWRAGVTVGTDAVLRGDVLNLIAENQFDHVMPYTDHMLDDALAAVDQAMDAEEAIDAADLGAPLSGWGQSYFSSASHAATSGGRGAALNGTMYLGRLDQSVVIDGYVRSPNLTATAQSTGGMSALAGDAGGAHRLGALAPVDLGLSDPVDGIGISAAVAFIQETSRVDVGQTAFLDHASVVTARVGMGLYLEGRLASSSGAQATSGGLALAAGQRDALALIDPDYNSNLIAVAEDTSTTVLLGGVAQQASDQAIGVGAAMDLMNSRARALLGVRDGNGVAVVADPDAVNGGSQLVMRARSMPRRILLASAGGSTTGKSGLFSINVDQAQSILGDANSIVRQIAEDDDDEDDTSDFWEETITRLALNIEGSTTGLGFAGAVTMSGATLTAEAIGGDLVGGGRQLWAVAEPELLSVAGTRLSADRSAALAGAVAIDVTEVTAKVSGALAEATETKYYGGLVLNARAASRRVNVVDGAAYAGGSGGRSVLGSVILDQGHETADVDLVLTGVEEGVTIDAGLLTLVAENETLRRGLAGADAQGTLIGAGGSFITSEYDSNTTVNLSGDAQVHTTGLTARANRVENDRFYSVSDGTAGLTNALTGGTGKSRQKGDTIALIDGIKMSDNSGPVVIEASASGQTEVVVHFTQGFQSGANVVLGSSDVINNRVVMATLFHSALNGTDLTIQATDTVASIAETRLLAQGAVILSGGAGRAKIEDVGYVGAELLATQAIEMQDVIVRAASDKDVSAALRVAGSGTGLSGGGAFTTLDLRDRQQAWIGAGALSADRVVLEAISDGDVDLRSVVMALAPIFAGGGSSATINDAGYTIAKMMTNAEVGDLTISAREGDGAATPRNLTLEVIGAGASTLLGGNYAAQTITQERRVIASLEANVAQADTIDVTATADTNLRSQLIAPTANLVTVNVLLNEVISDRDVIARAIDGVGMTGNVTLQARRADLLTAANADASIGLGGDVAVSVATAIVEGATVASADIVGTMASLSLDADHDSLAYAESIGLSAGALNVAIPVVTARVGEADDALVDPSMEGRLTLDASARAAADLKAEATRQQQRAELEAAREEDDTIADNPDLRRAIFPGTLAQLVATNGLEVTGAATVDARSTAVASASIGRLGFSMIGLQTMISNAMTTEEVAADIIAGNQTLIIGGALNVNAAATGRVNTSSMGIAVGGLLTYGLLIGESIDARRLRATITGARVEAGSVSVMADRDVNISSVGGAIGGNLNTAIGIGAAWSKVDGETTAAVEVDRLVSDSYVFVDANATGPAVAVSFGASAGGAVGGQMSVAVAGRNDDVTATITDSLVDAGGAIALSAFHMQGDTSLGRTTAVAATLGGSGSVGVGASVALTRITGTARAEAANSLLQTPNNLFVDAATGGQSTQVAIGGGGGGAAGVGASISVALRTDETIARLRDTDLDIGGSAAVLATQQATISNEPGEGDSLDVTTRNYVNSIGITAGIAGTAGVGASLATTVVKSRAVAEVLGDVTLDVRSYGDGVLTRAIDGSYGRHRGLLVRAGGDVSTITTAITAGVGGVAGVAAHVNVVTIKDEILARIGEAGSDPQPEVINAADVSVIGESINEHRAESFTAGAGIAAAGVGVGVTTLTMDRSVIAQNFGDIDATNVRVAATNDEGVFFNMLTGAGGTYAGVAGGIMVATLSTRVEAALGGLIDAATVNVDALQDRYLWQGVASGAGAAFAAVTGGLNILTEDDDIRASIMSPGQTGGVAGRVNAQTTSVTATRVADISLPTATLSGAAVGVAGSITVLTSDVNVSASVNGPVDGRDLTVEAKNTVNENGDALIVAPTLTGGVAAVGGTINVASLDHKVTAYLGAPASVDLTGNLDVLASQDRNLSVQALTGAVGGTGISGLIAVIAVGEIVEGLTDAAILEAALDRVEAEDVDQIAREDGNGQTVTQSISTEAAPEMQEASTARAAAVAKSRDRALGTTVAGVAADSTKAEVQNLLHLEVDGDVTIRAKDDTVVDAKAGAINVGVLLGAGGTGITSAKVGSSTTAHIGSGTRIYDAQSITLQALVGSDAAPAQIRSTSGAASFSAGGALNLQSAQAVSGRVVEASVGEEVVINDTTSDLGAEMLVEAKLVQDVTAEAVSTAGALIGAGAVVTAFADAGDLVQTIWGEPQQNVVLPPAQGIREFTSLTLRSIKAGDVIALADSTTVGLLAGGAATVSTAKDRATVLATVQRALVSDDDLYVQAIGRGDVLAEAAGSTLALAGGQGSRADAVSDRTIQAVADSDGLTTGAIEVRAASGDQLDADRVEAKVRAAQHGAVGGQGAIATTDLGGTVQALLISPDLAATDVTVSATSHADQMAEADSLGIRLLGGGGARAETNDTQEVAARIAAAGSAQSVALVSQSVRSTLADAKAGAGALVGGVAARAVDTVDASTLASLDTAGGRLNIDGLFAVRRSASHTHGAKADTTAVQAFGGSGAEAESVITATGGVRVDAGADIEAQVFDLQADSQLLRDTGDAAADAQAGDGSIASSSGAQATAVLSDTTRVDVGAGAKLSATSLQVASRLGTSSLLRGDLSARVVARGGVALPEAEAIRLATQTSEVSIGAGATVRGNGDIEVSALTQSDLTAASSADTRSLAASLKSDAQNRLDATGRVDVQGLVAAQGALDVTAGGAAHNVTATANFFAGSPIELSRAPRSTVEANLISRVDVAAAGQLSAGEDMRLNAQPTAVVVKADGRGRNAFRAKIADLVDALLAVAERVTGTEFADVDLDIDPDLTETLTLDSRIQNAGLIEAGTLARLDIVLGVDGTLSGPDGPLSPDQIARLPINYGTGSATDLADEILATRRTQEAELRAAGAIELADILALEIAETEAVLQALSDRANGPIDILRVGPVTLSGGNIEIAADTVTGQGTLSAAGDAGATIRVDRPDTMLLLDDIILPGTAGRIALGGSVIRTIDDLATITGAQVFEGDIALDTAGVRANAVRPWTLTQVREQTVLSTATTSPELVASAVHDLATVGDISNLSGAVRLSSAQGSILQGGRIDARDLYIDAPNGTVLVGLVPGVTHQGGDPDAIYQTTLRFIEEAGLSGTYTLPPRAPSLGAGIRAGNVSIYGDVVNVNGLVQAGVEAFTLDLPSQLDTSVPFGLALGERVLLHDVVQGGAYGISGNVTVWAVGQGAGRPARLQLGDAAAGGGRLRLAARAIVSTGDGQLRVLDGHAGIAINSSSTLTLETATLTTGEGQGRIEIIDTGVVVDSSTDNPFDRYATTVWQSVDMGNGTRGYTRSENGTEVDSGTRVFGADDYYAIRGTAQGAARLEWDVDRIWEIRNGVRTEPLNTPDGGDARRVGDMALVYNTEAANYVASTGGDFSLGGDYTVRVTRHSLSADSSIAIDFFGLSRADIDVNHMGAIDIGGAINATDGAVTLHTGPIRGASETTQGINRAITMQAGAAAITAESVTLISRDGSGQPGARTAIGTYAAPIRVADTHGGAITAITEFGRTTQQAGGDIFVHGTGRLLVDSVSGGSLSLSAQDDIQGLPGRGYLYAADAVTLNSRDGSITDLSLRRVPGAVRAIAEGDITFTHGAEQTFGALNLATVKSETGSVTINSSRAVLDANANDRIDLETEAALIDAIWQRAGLSGADRDALIAQEIDAAEAQRRADHDWFWTVTAAINAPYQADLAISLSAAEAAGLTEDEAQALRRERTDAYHRGYALTGLGQAADPATIAVGDGLGVVVGDQTVAETFADEAARDTYQAQQNLAFDGALDAAGEAEIADAFTFAAESLSLAARRSALLAAADTTVEVEPANIQAAGNVTLRGASVGRDQVLARLYQESDAAYVTGTTGTTYSIAEGDPIPREVLVALAQAARDDVTVGRVIRNDGSTATIITIQGVDDLDVEAGGIVVVEAIGVDGSINLGSEGGLTLANMVAPDRIRISSGGALVNSDLYGTTLSAQRITLEAGTGGIGTQAAPITFEGPEGDVGGRVQLDLRGASGIYLERGSAATRQTGADTVLGDAFTTAMLSVTNYDGSIFAADPQKVLIAGSLSLLANDAIGDAVDPLKITLTADKDLRLEAGAGDVRAEVLALTEADGIVTDGDVTIRRIEGRNVRVDADGQVSLKGDQQYVFGPNFTPQGFRQVLPAISARGAAGDGTGDVTIFAAGGVVDAGADPSPDTLIRDQVVDIEGGDLRLIGGAFGQASNAIETWVQRVSGLGDGGVFMYNRDDLTVASLSAGTGDMGVRTGSILSADFATQISAGTAALRGIRVELDQDLTFTGDALQIDGGQEITQTAGKTLRTNGTADLTLTALTATMGGTVAAGGALEIGLTGDGSFNLLAGEDVALHARKETTTGPQGQTLPFPLATPVTVTVGQVTAGQDASILAAGQLSVGQISAGGDLEVSSKDPALITQLSLGNVTAGNRATVRTDDLIGAGALRIDAPLVVAELGASDATLSLSRATSTLERLTSNNRVTVRGNTLNVQETFASDLVVKADRLQVTGRAQARNLTLQGLRSVDIAAAGQAIASRALVVDAGRLFEDNTTYTDATADLKITAGGRAIGETVTIYAADQALVTGIESTSIHSGTVISVTAASINDNGDIDRDFVANRPGQVTYINARTDMRGGQAFETAINTLSANTGRGTLGIAEADTLILGPISAVQGGLDIVALAGQMLIDAGNNGIRADGRVVLGASGSIFTNGAQRFEMPELFVTSFSANVGTAAQPFHIGSNSSINRLSVVALNGMNVAQEGFVQQAGQIAAQNAPITWVNTSRTLLVADRIVGALDAASDGLDGPFAQGRFATAPAANVVAVGRYPVIQFGKQEEAEKTDAGAEVFVDFVPAPPPNADTAARRTSGPVNFNSGGFGTSGSGQGSSEEDDEDDDTEDENEVFGSYFGPNGFPFRNAIISGTGAFGR